MSLQWISNTIFISRVKDAGPVWDLLHDLITLFRSQDDKYFSVRSNMDLEFLHITICYSETEYKVIFHILSSDSIVNAVSNYLSGRYHNLNIKCVEINTREDVVNLFIHEKGQLQTEKTIPKGLSKHLIEDLEKAPMQGRCYSITVPELFNQSESRFIDTLSDLKYNKTLEYLPDPDDDLAF